MSVINTDLSVALHPSTRQIRVLDIVPGHWEEDVKCDVRIVSLDDKPQYETLSYVWGDPTEKMTIKVSGTPVHVTPNLYGALQHVRYNDEKRTMWIDQLSINQWDMEEKASQVALMRDIYRQGSHCILWLGEIPEQAQNFTLDDCKAVFAFMREVAGLELCPAGQHDDSLPHHAQEIFPEIPVFFQSNTKGEAVRNAFTAFAMYGNPWWSRAWTIQESILPSSAELYWGSLVISRDDVIKFSQRMKSGPRGNIPCFPDWFQEQKRVHTELLRWILYPVHGFLYSLQGEEPLDMLMRWRHRKATDARDKVYALLGMLPLDKLPSARPCSYSISVPDLYARVTVDLIRHENSLRPLVASSEMVHQTPNVPTWAIDFACSNRVGKRQLKWWTHSHRYKAFSACGANPLNFSVSGAGDALSLNGVRVDRIWKANESYAVTDDQELDRSKLWKIMSEAEGSLETYLASGKTRSTCYPGGGSWNSALWRTMIGDYIMEEFPTERASSSHEEIYKETRRQMAAGKSAEPNVLLESLHSMLTNHAFFITETGYMGFGPSPTAPGDEVWVFYGGQVPFVMRPSTTEVSGNASWPLELVGDAYVHGLMDGQALQSGVQTRSVTLH